MRTKHGGMGGALQEGQIWRGTHSALAVMARATMRGRTWAIVNWSSHAVDSMSCVDPTDYTEPRQCSGHNVSAAMKFGALLAQLQSSDWPQKKYLPMRMPLGIQSISGGASSGGSSSSSASSCSWAACELPSSAALPRQSRSGKRGTLRFGRRGRRNTERTERAAVCRTDRMEKGRRHVVRPNPPASSEKKESIIKIVAMMTSEAVCVRS
eukprot:scaffold201930_cov35-Tisochrysis_lutea.AAC.2